MSIHGANYEKRNRKNPTHIINLDVPVQVHHLISQSKYAELKKEHRQMLFEAEYSIHDVKNLVGLPCTVAGACQLEVQLHKGNHSAFKGEVSYHEKVKIELNRIFRKVDAELGKFKCDGKGSDAQKKQKAQKYAAERKKQIADITDKMDEISSDMLDKIKDFEIGLTADYKHYRAGNAGCCGTTKEQASVNVTLEALRKNTAAGVQCTQINRHGSDSTRHYPKAPLGNYNLAQGK